MNEFKLIHEDTMHLLQQMYDPWELQEILVAMFNSDGFLIIPFHDRPNLDYIETNTVQRYNWRLN